MAGDSLQKLKSSLNRGVAKVGVMASSSLEKSKLKTQIETTQTDIQRLLLESGEAAYQIWLTGSEDYSPLHSTLALIQQKRADVERLNREILALDEQNQQIFGGTESVPPPQQTCPNCGARYSVPVKFCRSCGTKLIE